MHQLRETLNDPDSPTWPQIVSCALCTGGHKECMKFHTNFDEVCEKQNITAGSGRFTLARCSSEGEALTSFENHAATMLTETNDTHEECLNTHMQAFIHSVQCCNRNCVRQALHKPCGMKTCE